MINSSVIFLSYWLWIYSLGLKGVLVSNLRHLGMVFAFEVFLQTKERLSLAVFKKALKKGLLLRPLNNTIYLMPPYIITHEEIKKAVAGLVEILDELKKG